MGGHHLSKSSGLGIPRSAGLTLKAVKSALLARKGDCVQARKVYDKAEQIFAERSRAWSAVWLSMAHAHVLAAEN